VSPWEYDADESKRLRRLRGMLKGFTVARLQRVVPSEAAGTVGSGGAGWSSIEGGRDSR